MKKFSALILAVFFFPGCMSPMMSKRINALEEQVRQNHLDQHAEDKKLAEAAISLAASTQSNGIRIARIESNMETLQKDDEELHRFKAAHDKRWPNLMTDLEKSSVQLNKNSEKVKNIKILTVDEIDQKILEKKKRKK